METRDHDFGLDDVIISLVSNLRRTLLIPLITTLGVGVVTFAIEVTYTSEVSFYPPQTNKNTIITQKGGVVSDIAQGALSTEKPEEFYIGLLRSRAILEQVIERQDLIDYYDSDNLEDALRTFGKKLRIYALKDGIIRVAVDDKDAEKSAEIANSFISALSSYSKDVAFLQSERRNRAFEANLNAILVNLEKADEALTAVELQTGMYKLEGQEKFILDELAIVKQAIAETSRLIAGMESYATTSNPDYLRKKLELKRLIKKQEELEGNSKKQIDTKTSIPFMSIPHLRERVTQARRIVHFYDLLLESLATSYQVLAVDAQQDYSVLNTLDKASVPDRKSKPRRGLIIISTFIFSSIMTVVYTIMEYAVLTSRRGRRLLLMIRQELDRKKADN